MSALLEVEGLCVRFGGLAALDDVSLKADQGEILGLIGPNGAGKTTVVNAVSGSVSARGTVRFDGRSIAGLRPYQIARLGIARTYQIVQPFPELSALDNVAAGALFSGASKSLLDARKRAEAILERVGLGRDKRQPADALTLAQRKRLEVAKGLASSPRMLLLDEVHAGLNSVEIDDALRLIRSIAAEGVAVLLVEHLMRVVSGVCHRVIVLHHGRLIANGEPARVLAEESVIEAYLGRRYANRAALAAKA